MLRMASSKGPESRRVFLSKPQRRQPRLYKTSLVFFCEWKWSHNIDRPPRWPLLRQRLPEQQPGLEIHWRQFGPGLVQVSGVQLHHLPARCRRLFSNRQISSRATSQQQLVNAHHDSEGLLTDVTSRFNLLGISRISACGFFQYQYNLVSKSKDRMSGESTIRIPRKPVLN